MYSRLKGGAASFQAMPLPELTAEMLCDPALESKLACCVCHGIYSNPRCHVDCGHYACADCWSRVLHAGFDKCPTCRCALWPGGIKWNAAMEALLGSIQVKCGEECPWTGALEAYTNHLEECRAKRLKDTEAAMQQAARVSNTTIAELRSKIEELSRTLAQSRADHTRDVELKEEALHAVLEVSAADASAYRERLAAADANLKDSAARLREQEEQLKMKDQTLTAQRHKLAKTETQVQQLQDVLQEVLGAHEDYTTRLDREMASNRAALEKYRVAMQGRGRSRRPALSKTARVQK